MLAHATRLKALDDFLATVKAGIAIRDFKIGQTFECSRETAAICNFPPHGV